jgi:hypothetical protein
LYTTIWCSRIAIFSLAASGQKNTRALQITTGMASQRPSGLGPQLALAVGSGVRFGRQQQLVDIAGLPAGIGVPAELGAVGGLAFAEQQVVRLALDPLARLESQCLRAGSPPSAGRFPPVSLAWM